MELAFLNGSTASLTAADLASEVAAAGLPLQTAEVQVTIEELVTVEFPSETNSSQVAAALRLDLCGSGAEGGDSCSLGFLASARRSRALQQSETVQLTTRQTLGRSSLVALAAHVWNESFVAELLGVGWVKIFASNALGGVAPVFPAITAQIVLSGQGGAAEAEVAVNSSSRLPGALASALGVDGSLVVLLSGPRAMTPPVPPPTAQPPPMRPPLPAAPFPVLLSASSALALTVSAEDPTTWVIIIAVVLVCIGAFFLMYWSGVGRKMPSPSFYPKLFQQNMPSISFYPTLFHSRMKMPVPPFFYPTLFRRLAAVAGSSFFPTLFHSQKKLDALPVARPRGTLRKGHATGTKPQFVGSAAWRDVVFEYSV